MSHVPPDEDLKRAVDMDKHELQGWRDGIWLIMQEEPNAVISCHYPALLVYLADKELENIRLRQDIQEILDKLEDSQ